MGKIGCHKCGKEYGTNPDCPCWIPQEEEVQMKEGTWLVHHWRMDCPACKARVEEEAVYCPNCGKWLGVVRKHVWTFLGAALWLVLGGGSCLAVSKFVGDQSAVPLLWASMIFFILGALPVLAIKPFGLRLLWWEQKKRRAQEWNAEVAKRQKEERAEEDRAERERSANTKTDSGISLSLNVETGEVKKNMEKVRGQILRMLERPTLSPEEFPLLRGWPSPDNEKLGMIRTNKAQWLADIVEAGVSLGWQKNAEGEVESFFLSPIPEPVAEKFNERKLDPAFNIRSVLPVRNGPALQIAFIDSPDNRESLEDIKLNLEDVYRWKGQGIHRILDIVTDLRASWKAVKSDCAKAGTCHVCAANAEKSGLCGVLHRLEDHLENFPLTLDLKKAALEKDAKANGKFIADVMAGRCLCEYPVIPKERCPVHGDLREIAFKEGVHAGFEHGGWDEGPYDEDAQGLWEESETKKGEKHRVKNLPFLMGSVESVLGTAEPERVEIPVKFESGTWPVCCNKEMIRAHDRKRFFCVKCGRTDDERIIGDPAEGGEVDPDDCPCGDPTCLGCGERDDADEDFGIPDEFSDEDDG